MRVNSEMIETLNQLELAKGINEQILICMNLWESKQFGFFHGTKLGLDRKFDLGLTSAPLIDEDDPFEGDFDFPSFQVLVQEIQNNPHEATRLMTQAAERCNAKIWNGFYRKILLRRITWLTAKQFNMILSRISKSDIRADQFLVDLWQPQEFINGSEKDIRGSFFLEPYVEGQRQLLFVHMDGTIKALNDDGSQSDFHLAIDVDFPLNFVLDGILLEDQFWIFDFILMEQFEGNSCDMPLVERIDVLNQMIGLFQDKLPNLRILPKVEFTEVNLKRLQEVSQQYVAEGYSRACIKPLSSLYNRENSDWKLIKLS